MVRHDLTQEKEIHLTKRSVTDDDITTLLSKVVTRSNVLEVLNLRDNSIALANVTTPRRGGDYDDEEKEGDGEPSMKMMDIPPPPFPTFNDDDGYENDLSSSNEKAEDEEQFTTDAQTSSKIEPIKKRELLSNNNKSVTTQDATRDNKKNNALTIAISNSTTLIELDLQDNRISVEGCQNLSKALSTNTSIKILKLGGNKIGDEGLNHLCDAFVTNNNALRHVDLCNNLFGNGLGATKLVTSVLLNEGSNLISLDLSYNTIGDSTITKLSNSLCRRETEGTLQELNLSYNRIANEGGICLAHALSKNNTLKKLWINGNNIGDDGMNKFCETLGRKKDGNTSLIELWFNGNPISVKVYMTLLLVLEERKKGRGE